jgi:GT2 family glycosyltransferase
MPFAGDRAAAEAALRSLGSLDVQPGDQLILVDNTGEGVVDAPPGDPRITVLAASGERSPAHARNAGAARAANPWILFLDADTIPRQQLIAAFFARPIDDRVGAVAGEVLAAPGATTLAARYGAARSFLGQRGHFQHPYRPRATAANLLVRRAAFDQLGGFYEGVRAGEDTDFSWRLQQAGWRLELRSEAAVEHRYRATVAELRRQWRSYAAGRAWLARRHPGFRPEPVLGRALRRLRNRRPPAAAGALTHPTRRERGRFLGLDLLLGLEELWGLALSNRPPRRAALRPHARPAVEVVLFAERFPLRGDPLVELAATLGRVRVEALARPLDPAPPGPRPIPVAYLEDDGAAARWAAAIVVVATHPLRAALDLLSRPSGAPPLRALAPAVRRLERDAGARLQAAGAGHDRATATRLARLAGRSLEP